MRFVFAALSPLPFHSPSPVHICSAQSLAPPPTLQLEVPLLPCLDCRVAYSPTNSQFSLLLSELLENRV